MNTNSRRLCATAAGIVLCGLHSTLAQVGSGTNVPGLPTNIPNVQTFVAPPATFNPLTESPEAL